MYFLKPIQDVRSAYLWIYFGERRLLRSLLLDLGLAHIVMFCR
ncbi:hypothetical protein CK203_066566 [Vitis vinifera]|uniref:Uncharacterized protein n=1 Tax=Vitis vinifera TaxID=29760 RepID=A0A438EVJ3_VITVI|nr:hypothetical protein CK203_066566 [Vitis vinifera]